MEVLLGDTIVFPEVPLCLVPEVFDAVDLRPEGPALVR